MAKLEEISELLVSEIRDFEEAVKRLEKIQQQQITINSKNLESFMRQHQEIVRKDLLSHKQDMEILGSKFEKAKAYPLWALICFVVSIILNGILIYIVVRFL